jgi:hypothetical protein
MLRSDESNILEQALDLPLTKKATHFERVSLGNGKVDPFEGKVEADVWKVVGNKLLRKKASIQAFEKSAKPNKKNRDNWIETDKYDAGKEWNEGNELMFVWSQRPDGFVLDKHSVAKFFGEDADSFSLADVVKFGFPHSDLKMYKQRSFNA